MWLTLSGSHIELGGSNKRSTAHPIMHYETLSKSITAVTMIWNLLLIVFFGTAGHGLMSTRFIAAILCC